MGGVVPASWRGLRGPERPELVAKRSAAQSEGSVAVAAFTGKREFWSQLRPELAQPLPFLLWPVFPLKTR